LAAPTATSDRICQTASKSSSGGSGAQTTALAVGLSVAALAATALIGVVLLRRWRMAQRMRVAQSLVTDDLEASLVQVKAAFSTQHAGLVERIQIALAKATHVTPAQPLRAIARYGALLPLPRPFPCSFPSPFPSPFSFVFIVAFGLCCCPSLHVGAHALTRLRV
jgi:hypothetical protein